LGGFPIDEWKERGQREDKAGREAIWKEMEGKKNTFKENCIPVARRGRRGAIEKE